MTRQTKKTLTNKKTPTEAEKEPYMFEQAATEILGKCKLTLGGGSTTPKKERETLVKFPQTEEHLSLLAEKLKDHAENVWEDIGNTQREMLIGVSERITELQQVTKNLQKIVTVSQKSQVEVTRAGTSAEVPPKEKVSRHFQPTDTDDQVLVEVPQSVVQWKSISQRHGEETTQVVQLKIRHIPLDNLHQLYSQTHEELRQREEIVYKQKVSVEQDRLTTTKETRKAVQEKKDVEIEMSRIKKAFGTLSQTFPELVVHLEDTAKVAVRWVTDLVQSLQVKVEELGAWLVPTTPQEVYDARQFEAQKVIEGVLKTMNEYDMMLTEVVQTWSDLTEHPERVKIQAQLEEIQRKQEQLKQTMSNMSPFEKMQKDSDGKLLKQQFDSMKKKDENMATRIKPLQEATTILAQVIGKKQGELTTFLKETKVKLEEPVSVQLVEELKEQGNQVTVVITTCKQRYEELRQRAQKVKQEAE